MTKLYYTPPSKEIFDEVKREAIKVWQSMDNEFGYVDEKVNKIKDLKNVGDNVMFMVAMFDIFNQARLANKLSPKANKAMSDRIRSAGTPDIYNVFLFTYKLAEYKV